MPDLGTKHECTSCGTKFYDLGKDEPICPKCGLNQLAEDEPPPPAEPEEPAEEVAEKEPAKEAEAADGPGEVEAAAAEEEAGDEKKEAKGVDK